MPEKLLRVLQDRPAQERGICGPTETHLGASLSVSCVSQSGGLQSFLRKAPCYSAPMRPQLRRTVWNVLAMWGIASLLAVIAVAGFLAYSFASNKPRLDRATTRDVRFVLNWPGLGDDRIERVLHSYESTLHVNGDHFIAYEIRVTSLTVSELSSERGRWVRGDRMDALMKDAVQFVTEAGHEAPWLPSAAELSTNKYYVWRWRVEVNERVSAADLIFARPADRTIFYASLQV